MQDRTGAADQVAAAGRCARLRGRLWAAVTGAARRVVGRSSGARRGSWGARNLVGQVGGAAGLRPAIHSEETGPMVGHDDTTAGATVARRDDDRTTTGPALVVRSVRVDPSAWRAAAKRAKREGRGIAEVVGSFVAAYGAGCVDAPAAIGQAATRARFHPTASHPPTTDQADTTHQERR